ncbi:hypothetical protein LXD69_10250 [Flavobacterium sediminilitoris]|uniref:Uncharacterized protein n=1 Tax=Flavobacterium sediminilitoris TaxID=2024526 RepID=A0ABY4HIA2_9FLAO|nr:MULTISPECIES: hypothetical protein [Flavobacterium]UOX32433.1 hypothetical protein LXD69_10250 [Flavobacterium sediminilitoris]
MKTITVNAAIGNSKKLTTIIFLDTDFLKIENNQLFIKNDNRRMILSDEQVKQVIFQLELNSKSYKEEISEIIKLLKEEIINK